jgi:hypothetical protein
LFQHSSCSDLHLPPIRQSPKSDRKSLRTSSSDLSLKLDTDDEPTITTAPGPRRVIAFHRPTSASTSNSRRRSPTPSLTGLTTGTETDLDTETEEHSPEVSLSHRAKTQTHDDDFDLPDELRVLHHNSSQDRTPRPSALSAVRSRRTTINGLRLGRDSDSSQASSRTPRSSSTSSSTFEFIDACALPPRTTTHAQAKDHYDSSLSSAGDETETDAEYERLEHTASFSSSGSVHWAPGFDTGLVGAKGWALKRRRRKLKKKTRPSLSDGESARLSSLPFPKSPTASQTSNRPLLRSRESSAGGSFLSGDTDRPLAFAEDSGNEGNGESMPFPSRSPSLAQVPTAATTTSPVKPSRSHRRHLSLTAILPRSIVSSSTTPAPPPLARSSSRSKPNKLQRPSTSLSLAQLDNPSSSIPTPPETPPNGPKGFFARARRFSRSAAMTFTPSPPHAAAASRQASAAGGSLERESPSDRHERERAIARSQSQSPVFSRSYSRASPQQSSQQLLGVRPRPQPIFLDQTDLEKAPRASISALPTSTHFLFDAQREEDRNGGEQDEERGAGGRVANPKSGNGGQLARRLSLSDLKIPTRITSAQQKVGEDLKRIMQFRKGVKGLFSQKIIFLTRKRTDVIKKTQS